MMDVDEGRFKIFVKTSGSWSANSSEHFLSNHLGQQLSWGHRSEHTPHIMPLHSEGVAVVGGW